jgi:sugar lactone lactonase YvrE
MTGLSTNQLPLTEDMSAAGSIIKVDPQYGIAGGEVSIECEGFDTSDPTRCGVWFDQERAPIVALGSRRVLALVPEIKRAGRLSVRLESQGKGTSIKEFLVGQRLAEDLHPVANPAFDPGDGSLFVTRSGPRGEQLPVTLFRIDIDGNVAEFSGDIANPTGIAFNQSGQMFVTSRLDGTVYRVSPFREVSPFARNLGIATGIAFDKAGTMYVGDRSGTIFRVDEVGDEQAWAQLEPSVSAYHLAFGPDDALYVTGPTVTSYDSVYRIDQEGEVSIFYRGLGRPQGLAFDQTGDLYVAASIAGRRGIVRIASDGREAQLFIAGMNLVGLAFSSAGDIVIASNDAVYTLAAQIKGLLAA